MEKEESKDFPILPNITDASLAPVVTPGEGKSGGPFSGVTANGLFTTIYDNKLMVVIIVLVIIIIGIMAYVVLNKTKGLSLENIVEGPPGQQQPGALPPGAQQGPAPQQKQANEPPRQPQQQSPAPQRQPEQPKQAQQQPEPQTNKTKMASHEQIKRAMREIDSKQSKSKVEELPSETQRAPEPVYTEPAQTRQHDSNTQQEESDAFEISPHYADNTVHTIEGTPAISTCSYMLSTGKYCTNNSLENSDKCGKHQGEEN